MIVVWSSSLLHVWVVSLCLNQASYNQFYLARSSVKSRRHPLYDKKVRGGGGRQAIKGTHRRTDPKLLPEPAFGSRPTTFPTDAELLPLLLAQGMMEALAALNFSRQRSKQVLTSSSTTSFSSSCCTPVAVCPPPVEPSL